MGSWVTINEDMTADVLPGGGLVSGAEPFNDAVARSGGEDEPVPSGSPSVSIRAFGESGINGEPCLPLPKRLCFLIRSNFLGRFARVDLLLEPGMHFKAYSCGHEVTCGSFRDFFPYLTPPPLSGKNRYQAWRGRPGLGADWLRRDRARPT
jgi:hypothetical protein